MHDDISRGAHAPNEAGGENWPATDARERRGGAARSDSVAVELTAVILSVERDQPVVLAAETGPEGSRHTSLPVARFSPGQQPCLEQALRQAVLAQTGRCLGHVEQLLTDYGPIDGTEGDGTATPPSCLSVSYLALTRDETHATPDQACWLDCYAMLPWEDFRTGRPEILNTTIMPALEAWAVEAEAVDPAEATSRRERMHIAFGFGGSAWDDMRVVDRYDLIVEAGIELPEPAQRLPRAQCRLVAFALGRLRSKVRERPVVFELLPPEFTLFELQRAVEAVLGPTLHKQNFRRLVEGTRLVEPTGEVRMNTGGRPAKTFRFRREVLLERPSPGVHVRSGRAA